MFRGSKSSENSWEQLYQVRDTKNPRVSRDHHYLLPRLNSTPPTHCHSNVVALMSHLALNVSGSGRNVGTHWRRPYLILRSLLHQKRRNLMLGVRVCRLVGLEPSNPTFLWY